MGAVTTLTSAALNGMQVMTALDKTFMLGLHDKLDMGTMADIISSGLSAHRTYHIH